MKKRILSVAVSAMLMMALIICGIIGLGTTSASAANEKVDQQAVTVTIDTVSPSRSVTLSVDSTDGYYIISNADELDAFSVLVRTESKVYAKLTANITYNSGDLSTLAERTEGYREYMPAGMSEYYTPVYGKSRNQFTGVLDGQGHSISGLYYSKGHSSGIEGYGGLVTKLGQGGVIKNLTITRSYFADVSLVGAFAAEMSAGALIENCHNVGTTVRAGRYVGGIVGEISGGEIRNSTNSGSIQTYKVNDNVTIGGNIGGIAGNSKNCLIELCINTGTIENGLEKVEIFDDNGVLTETVYEPVDFGTGGGIVGQAIDEATVQNCLNSGKVGSDLPYVSQVGGIIGFVNTHANVYSNLSLGEVIGYQAIGHVWGGVNTPTDHANNFHCHTITVTREDVQTIWDEGKVTAVTKETLASGEVAYKLGTAWGQEIGKDPLPVFGGMKVFANQTGGCSPENATFLYSNTSAEAVITHDWDGGTATIPSTCTTHGVNTFNCEYCDESYTDKAALDPAKHEKNVSYGFYPCCDGIYDYVNYYENGVVKIRNEEQFAWLARYVARGNEDVNVILLDNFTVNDLTPIGTAEHPYRGTFDGNGKTVTMSITVKSGAAGLFAYTDKATVKDLTLKGTITLNGTDESNVIDCVGSVIGWAKGSTVTNCVSHVNISGTAAGGRSIAGIVGGAYNSDNTGTVVTNCVNYGNITVLQANQIVSGIVGYANQYGKIDNCANYGDVNAEGISFVAGILGYVNNSSFEGVSNCLNTGSIIGGNYTAAIVAKLNGHKANTFKNNYHYNDIAGYDPNKTVIEGESIESFGLSYDEMEGGRAAYGLNGGSADGIWKQTIGKDLFPTFVNTSGKKTVYAITGCQGDPTVMGYSNVSGLWEHIGFDDVSGACTNCGETTQPAYYNAEEGYYEIRNAGQLYWFAEMVNNENASYGSANARLMNNIVINNGTLSSSTTNAKSWTAIGKSGAYYSGTFDGNGKTVSGLYGSGLFGSVSGNAIIKNVGVINAYIHTGYTYDDGGINVGGIVGYNNGGNIRNCYFIGFLSGYNYVGGIVGQNKGTVENCMAIAEVRGSINLGFVAGSNSGGTVKNCYYYEYEYVSSVAGLGYASPSGGASGGTKENVIAKNGAFATGEVVCLLNQNLSEGDVAWGQMLGKGGDAYPTFLHAHNAVYYGYISCDPTSSKIYTNNSSASDKLHPHTFDGEGICVVCGTPNLTMDGDVYIIGSADELVTFAAYVNAGNVSVNAKLTSDVTLEGNVMIGNKQENAFSGSFDGNGFSITVAYNTSDEYTALFRYVNGATIKGLTLKGTVTASGKSASSFIASVTGGTVTLERCASYVTVNSTVEGDGTHGGLVSYVESGATLNIVSCLFAGEIVGESTTLSSGFVGFTNGVVNINNSLFAGKLSIAEAGASDKTLVRCGSSGSASITNTYYLHAYGTVDEGTAAVTEDDLKSGRVAYLLGAAWGQRLDTDTLPVIGASSVYQYTSCDGETLLYTNDEALSGTALTEHSMSDATCLAPATCRVCGLTEGDRLAHTAPGADGLCESGCGKKVVARVGDVYFVSLEDALYASSESGEVAVALADSTILEPIPSGAIFDGGTFTFDGDEVKNDGTIIGGSFDLHIKNSGTIDGGTFNDFVQNEGTVTGGTFNGTLGNRGTLMGGTINGKLENYSDVVNVANDEYTFVLGENFAYTASEGAKLECEDHIGGRATCTEAATCALCDESYGTVAPHDMADATCTSPAICKRGCGHTEGKALGHATVTDAAKAPTCTEAGLTEGSHCSRCGETLVKQDTVLELGHKWVDATTAFPKTCSVCGTTEGDPLPTPPVGGEETTEPEGEYTTEPDGEVTTESDGEQTTQQSCEDTTEVSPTESEDETNSAPSEGDGNTETTPTTDSEGGNDVGCGASIGIGAISIVALLGAAITFKKKED